MEGTTTCLFLVQERGQTGVEEIPTWMALLLAFPGAIAALPASIATVRQWLNWLRKHLPDGKEK